MQEIQFELAGEYLVMAATWRRSNRGCCCRARRWTTRTKTIRARSWCAACRSTSGSRGRRDIDALERHGARRASGERRRHRAHASSRKLPDITLKELLMVFKEVLERSTMFAHHHVRREPLSVRERMSNILVRCKPSATSISSGCSIPRGRIGVTVLPRDTGAAERALIEVVQAERSDRSTSRGGGRGTRLRGRIPTIAQEAGGRT